MVRNETFQHNLRFDVLFARHGFTGLLTLMEKEIHIDDPPQTARLCVQQLAAFENSQCMAKNLSLAVLAAASQLTFRLFFDVFCLIFLSCGFFWLDTDAG